MSSERQRTWIETVLGAFAKRGLTTDPLVVAAGGPSTTTLTKYRNALAHGTDLTPPRDDTFRRIDEAAGWVVGSARKLWMFGDEPTPLENVVVIPPAAKVGGSDFDWQPVLTTLTETIQELREENARLRAQIGRLTGPGAPDYSLAARTPGELPEGQRRRAAQDAAGEESQDPDDA